MRFADPLFLWMLAFIPVLAAYLAFSAPTICPSFRLSTSRAARDLPGWILPTRGVFLVGALRLAGLTLLILAFARPQRGLRSEEMTTKATDIVFVLDASRSMLSIDFKPDNRFQVAKNTISDFIKGRDKDRLGLVLFAEQAVTQCPLTTDRGAILQILDGLEVGAIPPDHTAIGIGLATAVNRLKNSQAKSKVIILLTDGANNAGAIDPLTAAKTADAFGIKIYAIGVGSPDGGLMPVDDPARRTALHSRSRPIWTRTSCCASRNKRTENISAPRPAAR